MHRTTHVKCALTKITNNITTPNYSCKVCTNQDSKNITTLNTHVKCALTKITNNITTPNYSCKVCTNQDNK